MKDFVCRHVGVDEAHQQAQLSAIGYADMDALLADTVPASVAQSTALDWAPLSEAALQSDLKALALQNSVQSCYLGQGYVPCHTPAVIMRHLLENPGWYTQYTPYQAEIAQGRLELLFYFQSMIAELTALPVANASLLDEGTAAAEAMLLLYQHRNKRKVVAPRFVVEAAILPQTLAVLHTRARPLGIEIDVLPRERMQFDNRVFGVLLSYPDAHGVVHDQQALMAQAKAVGVKVAVCCDLLALTQLKPPGEWGADIACGSCQRYGVPMGFGGPHAAFFAVKDELKRLIPGRVVGVTRDAQNHSAFRLAMQTREQHIRREKATSNICTAQALLAMASTLYAMHHGPQGLQSMALHIHGFAQWLAKQLQQAGATLHSDAFFDTLRFSLPESDEVVLVRAKAHGVQLARVGDAWQLTLSELCDRAAMAVLLEVLTGRKVLADEVAVADVQPAWPKACTRSSAFMVHEVFHQYHAESDLMRYMKRLEQRDLSLVHRMIPLGSCTMKLNPAAAMLPFSWDAFHQLHPLAPLSTVTGMLTLIDRLDLYLRKITGFAATSFQPNAGAQGEYAGLLAIRAYHLSRGEQRDVALVPSSAHGTNPASAVLAGMKVVVVRCAGDGSIDVEDLKAKCEAHANCVACLMVTYPSTFGVFDDNIKQICDLVHEAGAQVYMDGANMNAQLGLTSPAHVGADVCHLNLHKTFCIPHGGGGPGMGPICVAEHLKPFLPKDPLRASGADDVVSSAMYGSASILLISYAYIRLLGGAGLRRCAEQAILNANYMAHRLKDHYGILYTGSKGRVAHEFIIDCRQMEGGVKALDIAKRLMDYGLHAPTLSWPVADTLMIEPTESESKLECDLYCDALIAIRKEIAEITDPSQNILRNAPHTLAMVTANDWPYAYSREQAAWPQANLRQGKCWPSVGRVDDVYGDRHLVCSCADLLS